MMNNPLSLAKSLRLMGSGVQPSLWHKLRQIKIPVVLVVGALDHKFVAINQKMLADCSTAFMKIVENTGHNVHFEQPTKFSQIIKQFEF